MTRTAPKGAQHRRAGPEEGHDLAGTLSFKKTRELESRSRNWRKGHVDISEFNTTEGRGEDETTVALDARRFRDRPRDAIDS